MRKLSLLIATLVILQGTGECDEASEPPEIEFAVVGTLGECPAGEGAISVQVDAHGRISAGGQGPLSLHQLEGEIEKQTGEEGWKEEDGSSRKALVLEVDRTLPWAVTVWVVKAGLRARPWPREIFFAARAEKDGAKGAIGWSLPRKGQHSSVAVPWTAAVLELAEGDADDPRLLLPVLNEARSRAADDGETRLDILAPRSGDPGVPTGYVLRLFDLALRAGVTDVRFEGRGTPPHEDYESLDWLLDQAARLRQEGKSPRLRVVGRRIDRSPRAVESLPSRGVLPRRYGLDVVAADAASRARSRGRPSLYRLGAEAGKHALEWLAGQQLEGGGWDTADSHYEVAATALAVQAFLRRGYTNRGRHKYAKVVSKGLRFLKDQQREDGRYVPESSPHALYGHAVATLAMAEAYDRTGSPVFKYSLQRALDAIAELREPSGLWAQGSGATSLDLWMALPVATVISTNLGYRQRDREPSVRLNEEDVAALRAWIVRHGSEESPSSEALSGVLIRLRVLLGEDRSEGSTLHEELGRHGRLVRNLGEGLGDIANLAHGLDAYRPPEHGHHSWTGWGAWHPVALAIVTRQRWDGGLSGRRGSWDPSGGEVFGGGRVVSTAIAARALAPYGHVIWGTVSPTSRFGD